MKTTLKEINEITGGNIYPTHYKKVGNEPDGFVSVFEKDLLYCCGQITESEAVKNSLTPALIYDQCFNGFITKLTANPKSSVLDWNHKLEHVDSEGREVVIYYHVENICENAQTDKETDAYVVDRVSFNGLNLIMNKHYERELLDSLNCINPLQIKF